MFVSSGSFLLSHLHYQLTETILGICHSGGGALLQQKKELILTNDMNSESTYYQYTTVSILFESKGDRHQES
jgi:hypothetical protein